jgi:hypothetical protein
MFKTLFNENFNEKETKNSSDECHLEDLLRKKNVKKQAQLYGVMFDGICMLHQFWKACKSFYGGAQQGLEITKQLRDILASKNDMLEWVESSGTETLDWLDDYFSEQIQQITPTDI